MMLSRARGSLTTRTKPAPSLEMFVFAQMLSHSITGRWAAHAVNMRPLLEYIFECDRRARVLENSAQEQ
jgi:hypothetical protein